MDVGIDRPGVAAASVFTDAALLPLDGPAALVAALAEDGLTLRERLDNGVAALDASLLSACS